MTETLPNRKRQDPSPADFDAWEAKLADGDEPSQAARDLGFTASGFRRIDPDRHAAALQVGRAARAEFVDRKVEGWINDGERSDAIRLAWMKRWNGAYVDKGQVELTGRDGAALEVTSPDVKDAIERFTAALVPLNERARAAVPPELTA